MRRAALAGTAALLLSLLTPTGSSAAGPRLFKCIDGGRTVYQQQACPVTSQVDAAPSPVRASAKAASEPAPRATARLKQASPTASSVPATPR